MMAGVGAIAFTVAGGLAGALGVDDSDVLSEQAAMVITSATTKSATTIRWFIFFINPSLLGFKVVLEFPIRFLGFARF